MTSRRRRRITLVSLGLVGSLWLCVMVAAYQGVARQSAAIERFSKQDPASLSADDFARMERAFDSLGRNIRVIGVATSVPFGGSDAIGNIPWLGARYSAGRNLLRSGQLLADAGESTASLGEQVLKAFDATGVVSPAPAREATWLDVIVQGEDDIDRVARQIEEAQMVRAGVDDSLLPSPVRARMARLDRALERNNYDALAAEYLPALKSALGAERPVRYLVLFENPAELRPSGGFFGSCALVTISRGQIVDHTIFSSFPLTVDYAAQREVKRPQPWPVDRYLHLPENGLLFHDANWSADFPQSGALIMSMYAETNWPPIDGVVAVVPAVAGDLLRVTGPVTLTIDGATRTFTAERIHEQIEAQRLLQDRADPTTHKDLIGLIGEEIVERLKGAGRPALQQAAMSLLESADRRDVQIYSPDHRVQAVLDARGWTGRIVPDATVPTLAITFANFAPSKSSNLMQPRLVLRLSRAEEGQRRADIQLDLKHNGSPDVHPFYSGRHRWWIDIRLPDRSRRVASDPAAMPDPESPNGGSYLIDLWPEQTRSMSVTFTMPDSRRLMIRRQPGLTPLRVTIIDELCPRERTITLDADRTLDLSRPCRHFPTERGNQ